MSAETAGEKTEAPTPKRQRDAADKGEVLRSRELATAAVVLGGVAWLALAGPALVEALKAVLRDSLAFGRGDIADFAPWRPLRAALLVLAPSLAGLFALTMITGIAAQAGLGGARFNPALMGFKASRINPAAGLKRMFGTQGLIELGKGLLKVALLGGIGAWMLLGMKGLALGLPAAALGPAVAALGGSFVTLLLAMAGGLAVIAAIDVPVQAIRLRSRLRMTRQEVKDEHKESEGAPELKAAQRQRQREILKGGMRGAVAGAHVVLTNPTHFSVALRYERGQDEVPVVVAKGRGAKALAIRELARELDKPVLEYPSLARAVYFTSREGQQIRDDLYVAVATVLAFVFGVNLRAGGGQPAVLVPDSALFDEHGAPQRR